MAYPYLEVEDSRNVLSLQLIGCPHSRIPLRELWECQLVPLLFFIPILNNGKTVPGNLDVANNTLWLFILEVGVTLLRRILSSLGLSLLSGVFGVLSTLVGIFTLATFICAVSGNAFKIPKLGEIKIIK